MSLKDIANRTEDIVKDYNKKIAEYLGTEETVVIVREEGVGQQLGTLGLINPYSLEITIFKNDILKFTEEIVKNHFSNFRNNYGTIACGFETAIASSFEQMVVRTLGHEYGHLLQIRYGRLNGVETLLDHDVSYSDKWYEQHAEDVAMSVVKYFFGDKDFNEEIPDIEKYIPKPKKLPLIKSNGNQKILEALTTVRFTCSMIKNLTPGKNEGNPSSEYFALAKKACALFEHEAGKDGKEIADHFSKTLNCLDFATCGNVIKNGGELESIKRHLIQPLENMINESDISLIANRMLVESYERELRESMKSNVTISDGTLSRFIQLEFTPRITKQQFLSAREKLK